MKAYEAEKSAGHLKNTKYLTVVDFTKNQLTNNRLFVIDMETNTVTYAEKCGHGE
ncbi:murein L,D-transpeptidase catalytic domain family protein [bacterium]|nr:murein L,D-transpeptidase catalytic domain family protein [bacterium]